MRKNTTILLRRSVELICLILVFGMLICSFSTFAVETEEPASDTVDVVKLVNDVPRGNRVGEKDIEIVKVKNENIPANIVSDPEYVEYKYAKEDLYAGEYVGKEQVTDANVSKADDSVLLKPITKCDSDYVVVTDYIMPNTGTCVAVYLQQIIDENPRKTIYFPDGEYVISTPLFTSAAGKTSTSIQLSDGAVIKASKNFKNRNGNAMICLGGGTPMNDIQSVGSYYVVSGGTLDTNAVTRGISVDSGRESVIRNICIKNVATCGIYVARGANNGSSDLDFEDITILGLGMLASTGVYVDGYDNTFTNIRIYNCAVGMDINTGGNLIKSIYVSNDADKSLASAPTEGINSNTNNWISQCHTVNVQTAFSFGSGSEVWDCSAEWTTTKAKTQRMFRFNGNSLTVSGCRADFCVGEGVNTIIVTGNSSIKKFIEASAFNVADVTDKTYEQYLADANTIIPRS